MIKDYTLGEDLLRGKTRLLRRRELMYSEDRSFESKVFETKRGIAKISVSRKDPEVVITGLRVHVGAKFKSHMPSAITVFSKTVCVTPGVSRWYEIPFTPAEILVATKCLFLELTAGRKDSESISVDAVVPYGMKRVDLFIDKWPTDSEIMQMLPATTKVSLEAAVTAHSFAGAFVATLSAAGAPGPENSAEPSEASRKVVDVLLRAAPSSSAIERSATDLAHAAPVLVAQQLASFLASLPAPLAPEDCVRYYTLFATVVAESVCLKEDTLATLCGAMKKAVTDSLSDGWGFASIRAVLAESLKAAAAASTASAAIPKVLETAHVFLTSPNASVRTHAAHAVEALVSTAYEAEPTMLPMGMPFTEHAMCPKGVGRLEACELVRRASQSPCAGIVRLARSAKGVSALRSLLSTLVKALEAGLADPSVPSERLIQESCAVATLTVKVGPPDALKSLTSSFALGDDDDLSTAKDGSARKAAVRLGLVAYVLRRRKELPNKKARVALDAVVAKGFPQAFPGAAYKALVALVQTLGTSDAQPEASYERALAPLQELCLPDILAPREWGYGAWLASSLLVVSREMLRHTELRQLFSEAEWLGTLGTILKSGAMAFAQELAASVMECFKSSDDAFFRRLDERIHTEVLSAANRIAEAAFRVSVRDALALTRVALREFPIAFQRPSSWAAFCYANPQIFTALLCVALRTAMALNDSAAAVYGGGGGGGGASAVPQLKKAVPVLLYLASTALLEGKKDVVPGGLFRPDVLPLSRFVPTLCVYHPCASVRRLAAKVLEGLLPHLTQSDAAELAEAVSSTLRDIAAYGQASTAEFMEFVTFFACSVFAPQDFELELLDAFSAQIGLLARYRDPSGGGVARGSSSSSSSGCPFCHEYPVGTPVSVAAVEKKWPGKGEVRVKQSKNGAAFEFPQQITADSVSVTFARAPTSFVSVHCLLDGVWCPVGCKMTASSGGAAAARLEFPFFVPFSGIKIEVTRRRHGGGNSSKPDSSSSSGYSLRCSMCKSPNCGVYCAKCHSFRNEITSVVLNVDKSSLVSVDSEESASAQRKELETELGKTCLLSFRPFVPN